MEEPFYTQDEFPENMSSTDGMKIIYGKELQHTELKQTPLFQLCV